MEQAITDILLKIKIKNFLIFHFRAHFITIPSFGATELLTTFQEARLALTHKRRTTDLLEHILLQDLSRYEDR